ncbi:DNA cytosine methyltransferase [Brochothrix thermosphacta]|uniref:DNA (cytosine-5-)-methyltransferase n=1 Tax=Brochothrix thermosphacta TaxID=2756 RepID=A0A2X0QES5_BROTH|nr:DNA cytosine methyltransferase [Brochothrix thermosphacta]SPP27244.1 Modification methylase SinI [Brochothrix thermosphacta]
MQGELLSVSDASTILGCSDTMTRKFIKLGELNAKQVGKTYVTTEAAIKKFIEKGLYVINPSDRVRQTSDIPKITCLSFFSGAQGLDIGLERAGIKPLLACEFNKDARATIVQNDSEIGLIGDIWEATPDKIYQYANIPKNHKVDIIVGGPSCQAFSTAGTRKGFNDSRGEVLIQYLNIIEQISPEYVVLENVRGMYSTPAIISEDGVETKGGVLIYTYNRLTNLGYSVTFELYNSANFGAPQKRERIVIIAKKGNEKLPHLVPTHSEAGEYGLDYWVTLKEAIGDIQGKAMNYLEIPEKRRKWFEKIPEGGNWKSLTPEDAEKAMGKSYFLGGGKTGFLRRLSFDKPSPTLVTNPLMPATDLVHPHELRALSIEEYARIQGFPDNWVFKGKIGEQYKQIGNAVPTMLGTAIGKLILNDIQGFENEIIEGFSYSRYKNTDEINFFKSITKG